MKKNYILLSTSSCHIPRRFWSWQIVEEESIKEWEEKGYSRYSGCPALIPENVRDAIVELESSLGYEIQRPKPENIPVDR